MVNELVAIKGMVSTDRESGSGESPADFPHGFPANQMFRIVRTMLHATQTLLRRQLFLKSCATADAMLPSDRAACTSRNKKLDVAQTIAYTRIENTEFHKSELKHDAGSNQTLHERIVEVTHP